MQRSGADGRGAAVAEIPFQVDEVYRRYSAVTVEVGPPVPAWLTNLLSERQLGRDKIGRCDSVIVIAVAGPLQAHFYVGNGGAAQHEGAAGRKETGIAVCWAIPHL